MKTPGPDHPITLTPATRRWRAFFAGHVIADTNDAIVLEEASYRPVVYFPREDVAMEYMSRTAHVTHCPYKGDAAYYTLLMDGELAENAVWTYEQPYPAMAAIEGRLAFYPDKVEVYEVDDAVVNPHHHAEVEKLGGVDAIVQHTDAGDGASQRERWPPNAEPLAVEQPDDGGLR
jgi:uncharacterized protein (DUF427 family)